MENEGTSTEWNWSEKVNKQFWLEGAPLTRKTSYAISHVLIVQLWSSVKMTHQSQSNHHNTLKYSNYNSFCGCQRTHTTVRKE